MSSTLSATNAVETSGAHSGRVLLNRAAGHLVRTKPLGVDERGGSVGGSSVLSSPLAVRKA